MTYRTLDVQLNVDDSGRPLGESAYLWFATLADGLAGAERAALAELPAPTTIDPYAERAQGTPGQPYGICTVSRSINGAYPAEQRRTLSRDGWAWLRAELAGPLWDATVEIGRFDDRGFLGRRVLHATVRPSRKAPGWMFLQAQVDAADFGAATTLRALRSAADRLNPGFGHVDYGRQKGATALEWFTWGRDVPREWRDPQLSIAETRRRLRGYSWLTIASEEVAGRLGGVAGLAATGAFVQVEQLAAGGVWLLAAGDFRDWTPQAAEPVFRAVAPVLVPGVPRPRPAFAADEPPVFLTLADPSTIVR